MGLFAPVTYGFPSFTFGVYQAVTPFKSPTNRNITLCVFYSTEKAETGPGYASLPSFLSRPT